MLEQDGGEVSGYAETINEARQHRQPFQPPVTTPRALYTGIRKQVLATAGRVTLYERAHTRMHAHAHGVTHTHARLLTHTQDHSKTD